MAEMIDLRKRYGQGIDTLVLSDEQKKFLADPKISDNTDTRWNKTVSLNVRGEGLTLFDTFTYISHNTYAGGPISYAHRRIPIYRSVIGSSTDPEKVKDQTYRFELTDGSSVTVRYDAIKDRG